MPYDPRLSELAEWLRSANAGAVSADQLAELYLALAILLEGPQTRPLVRGMGLVLAATLRMEANRLNPDIRG